MKKFLLLAITTLALTAPVFSGNSDTDLTKVNASDLQLTQPDTDISGIRLNAALTAQSNGGCEQNFTPVTVVDELVLQNPSGDYNEAKQQLAKVSQRLKTAGTFVLGTIDSGNNAMVYFITTKNLRPGLTSAYYAEKQTFTFRTREDRKGLDKILAEAEANMQKAGMTYLAESITWNYPEYEVEISYLRAPSATKALPQAYTEGTDSDEDCGPLTDMTVVDELVLQIPSDDIKETRTLLAKTQKRLQAKGIFVLGTTDNDHSVRIYFVTTKHLRPGLTSDAYASKQTFTIISREDKAVIDKKLAEAEVNMQKAGLTYLAESVTWNYPLYTIDVSYLRK